jgi:O-antigen/teichoic acid export membrane protein
LTYLRPESSSASVYDVAYSIVQVGMMVLTVGLGGVVLAAMSRFAASDRTRMRSLYHVAVRLTSSLTIPVMAFLALAAPDLIALVYSRAYAGSAEILRILLCLRIMSRLFAAGENADLLLALGAVWTVVRIGLVAACVTVALHVLLIPGWGAPGAAIASGSGVLLANFLGSRAAIIQGGVAMQWQAWVRIMLAALGAAAVTWLLPHAGTPLLHLAISGVVFFALFVFLACITRPLLHEDVEAMRSAFGRLPAVMRFVVRQ